MNCDITEANIQHVLWKHEASSAHALRMNFTVKEETSCIKQFNLREKEQLQI